MTSREEKRQQPCPKAVVKRASALYFNGIGVQAPNGLTQKGERQTRDSEFVIAHIRMPITSEQLAEVRRISDAAVGETDWIGHEFVTLNWADYDRLERVYTALLTVGVSFLVHSLAMDVYFDVKKGDTVFSWEAAERKWIDRFEKDLYPQWAKPGLPRWLNIQMCSLLSVRDAHKDERNWRSEAGKQWCRSLLEEMPDRKRREVLDEIHDPETDFHQWDCFHRYDHVTLQDLPSSTTTTTTTTSTFGTTASPRKRHRRHEVIDLTDNDNGSATMTTTTSSSDRQQPVVAAMVDTIIAEAVEVAAAVAAADAADVADAMAIVEQNEGDNDYRLDECMICMDRPPTTMVLPCMHVVCCRQCSDRLKRTRDRRTCVRCRQRITDVLESAQK